MQVTMKETRRGSEDGFVVRCYEQGQTYNIADGLAREFLGKGWAEEANKPDVKKEELISLLKAKETAKRHWEGLLMRDTPLDASEQVDLDIAINSALDVYWEAQRIYNAALTAYSNGEPS